MVWKPSRRRYLRWALPAGTMGMAPASRLSHTLNCSALPPLGQGATLLSNSQELYLMGFIMPPSMNLRYTCRRPAAMSASLCGLASRPLRK